MDTNAGQRGYPDLHDHLDELRRLGLLIEIDWPNVAEELPLDRLAAFFERFLLPQAK